VAEKVANALEYGVTGDGVTDDSASLTALARRVSDAGGGSVYLPARTYFCNRSFRLDGCSRVRVFGDGAGTVLLAGPELDGSGDAPFHDRNNLISCLNFVKPGEAYRGDIVIEDVRLECGLQSAGVLTTSKAGGPNRCAVEVMNVHRCTLRRLQVVGACGNGLVIGSQDARPAYGVLSPVVEDCQFSGCVRTLLLQYGAESGACVQVGSASGGRVRDNFAVGSGGPLLDCFSCRALEVVHNVSEGVVTVPGRKVPQEVGGINGGWGLHACRIAHNSFTDAGGICLRGMPVPIPQTQNEKAPGPQFCLIEGNEVRTPLGGRPGIEVSGWTLPGKDRTAGQGWAVGNHVNRNTLIGCALHLHGCCAGEVAGNTLGYRPGAGADGYSAGMNVRGNFTSGLGGAGRLQPA
jgi:hypothetical protein